MNEQYNNPTPPNTWEQDPYRKPRISWNKIALGLILLGACLFAVGWLTGARGGRVYFNNGASLQVAAYPLEEHETTAINLNFSSDIHTINITSASCSIRILPTNEAVPRVVSSSGRNIIVNEVDGRLYVDTRNIGATRVVNGFGVNWNRSQGLIGVGTLGVSFNRTNEVNFMEFNFDISSFSFANFTNRIYVYVPSTVRYIDARGTSGSIRLENVSTVNLRLQTVSGSVTVDGGNHPNAHLQTTSGSVRGNGVFGNVYARSTSGSVNITDSNISHAGTNRIQLETTSGSVRFYTSAPRNNFNYNISVTSGSMRIDGSRQSGRSFSGGSGNVPISARSTSGSVQLNFSR